MNGKTHRFSHLIVAGVWVCSPHDPPEDDDETETPSVLTGNREQKSAM